VLDDAVAIPWVGQALAALPHQMQAPTEEVARGPHGRRVDVGLWQRTATAEDFGRAHVRQPGPREHALGRHDQTRTVRRDDLEEGDRGRRDVTMDEHLAGAVEHTHVHGLHVPIDPAVIRVLAVVESHRSSSCANAHLPCGQPTLASGSRGGGLYEDHRAAAVGTVAMVRAAAQRGSLPACD
jgi:hypothetical protein